MSGDQPYRVHHITEQRVVEIIDHALVKRDAIHRDEVRGVIESTVDATLTRLGIDAADPVKTQSTFAALRDWCTALGSAELTKDFIHLRADRQKKERFWERVQMLATGAWFAALTGLLVLGITQWRSGG